MEEEEEEEEKKEEEGCGVLSPSAGWVPLGPVEGRSFHGSQGLRPRADAGRAAEGVRMSVAHFTFHASVGNSRFTVPASHFAV